MTIHLEPLYGIAYADTDTAVVDLATVTQQAAVTTAAALARGGIAPPNATTQAQLAARITSLETKPRVTAYRTEPGTAMTLPTSPTVIPFTSASARSSSGMWASTKPTRLVAPVAGEYDLLTVVVVSLSAAAGQVALGYKLNGGAETFYDIRPSNATFAAISSGVVPGIVLAAGDYVELSVLQNSAAGRPLQNDAAGYSARATLQLARY